MCGIVAYAGPQPAYEHLVESLRLLEYRGYDSTGMALLEQSGKLCVHKAKGKLGALLEMVTANANGELRASTIGIGHTRWATQGVPSDANAHPHTGHASKVAIVHNGIIHNYNQLRKQLQSEASLELKSETDSELIAHMMERNLDRGMDMLEALREVKSRLHGTFAICVISQDQPHRVAMTCQEAPLVLGQAKDGGVIAASDSVALLSHTNRIWRLPDGYLAEIRGDGTFQIYDSEGQSVSAPTSQQLVADTLQLDKGGYKHYLLKEIHEQPAVVRNLLSESLPEKALELAGIDRILIVGCGTAYYAGMVGKLAFETLAQIPTEVEFASELLGRPVLADEGTLLIVISQSGETTDTIMATKAALQRGARMLAITNRPESTLASLSAGRCLISNAGVEVSVAATKSFTAQLISLYRLALELSGGRDNRALKDALHVLPQYMEQILTRCQEYKRLVLPYASKRAFIFLGRGFGYPIAMEGALKLKEITYIQATGYAAGEMKHGPIATVDEGVPTVSILYPGPLYHKTLHNMIEAKTRGAPSLGVVADGDQEAREQLDVALEVPRLPEGVSDLLSPFLTVMPLQLMAYYLAEYLGKDVDQPRNLAKSVTVE